MEVAKICIGLLVEYLFIHETIQTKMSFIARTLSLLHLNVRATLPLRSSNTSITLLQLRCWTLWFLYGSNFKSKGEIALRHALLIIASLTLVMLLFRSCVARDSYFFIKCLGSTTFQRALYLRTTWWIGKIGGCTTCFANWAQSR